MEIKIYVANLEKYNSGELYGKWLTLPMEQEELAEEIQTIAGNSDYAIHDYEAPFYISEYESPFELNELLLELYTLGKHLDDEELEALLEYADSLQEAVELLREEQAHFYHLDTTNPTWGDLAECLVYDYDYMEIPEHLKYYIDYEKLGRDLEYSGNWYLSKNGVAIELIW